ncbi:MAG: hypothetical protein ACI9FR_003253 [Cryomorphaceae bacterium]|jgi:hypothetical protein
MNEIGKHFGLGELMVCRLLKNSSTDNVLDTLSNGPTNFIDKAADGSQMIVPGSLLSIDNVWTGIFSNATEASISDVCDSWTKGVSGSRISGITTSNNSGH